MKVVVFGGSGFLGSHIADALTEGGHEVTIFDLKQSPYLQKDQEMVKGDILDPELVDRVVEGSDVVYNLAGLADIDDCVLRPFDVINYNILGNTIILEAARRQGIGRFVFASSVYVYSQSGSFYRISKQTCESFIESYNSLYGLPYTILRFGSLYGERAGEGNSVYKILKEAMTTGKISHYGDGEEYREYIHVRDAAELSVEILKKEYENQSLILTGSQPMKYADLLEMIKEIFGHRVEVEYRRIMGEHHYKITPYSFNPKMGRKLTKNPFIDMGQGLLNCITEIYEDVHGEKQESMGLFIDPGNNK